MGEGVNSHKIMEMDEQKRERIINAAMVEFCNGYKKASTDVIVREAGISKGLLFHYFGSKEKLYEFLLEYSIETFSNEYFDLINLKQRDLLERIWQMSLLKMDLSYKYPAIFDFMGAAYARSLQIPDDKFAAAYKKIQEEVLPYLFDNIDTSLFKDGLDVEKMVNIIRWTMIGYANSRVSVNKTTDDYRHEFSMYLEDFKEYFALFRELFYK